MRFGSAEALAPVLLSHCTVRLKAAGRKHLDSIDRVRARQHIGSGEMMVDPDVELISIGPSGGCVIESSCGRIRIRIKGQKECRLRRYSRRGDDVSRERLARKRVD